MIVVVTGSRKLTEHPDRLEIKSAFVEAVRFHNPDLVFHGGAAGPDAWAAFAFPDIQKQFNPVPSPARTPAQRLFDRNLSMINVAIVGDTQVHMVACWDGKSKGTKHAMDYAQEMDVPITVMRIDRWTK